MEGCIFCAIAAGQAPSHPIAEDDAALAFMDLFPASEGHALVIPKAHVTSYGEVDPATWAYVNELAHVAARVAEIVMRPRLCYVASIGSNPAVQELLQSSRHLHIHIIPVHRSEDRPADIFSWVEGVYVAEPPEWEELRQQYRSAWPSVSILE